LIVEVHHAFEDVELEGSIEVVMLESKIGSSEGEEDQLKRYAEHLSNMSGTRKTLVYITRAFDPKGKNTVLSGTSGVCFEQLRWHDVYRFLQTVEKDALVEEVMLFMEEQGMARSYRFSTTDLIALSGVPRALDIFDETLGEEVKSELESFAGNKLRREPSVLQIRRDEGYFVYAPLTSEGDLLCYVGYEMNAPDEYPTIQVDLSVEPGASGRQLLTIVLRQIAQRADWQSYDLDNPDRWSGVWRENSLATLLAEEDHVAAVKRFFIESIRQLREELTAFKKEHLDLPWDGG
jgi:hypothetical protein